MKRKIMLSLYGIIVVVFLQVIMININALPVQCVWSCYNTGPCAGTHPLLGDVQCEMYTIGSSNCGISAFNVYVDATYVSNYCQYW